jgi:hypothetical protein
MGHHISEHSYLHITTDAGYSLHCSTHILGFSVICLLFTLVLQKYSKIPSVQLWEDWFCKHYALHRSHSSWPQIINNNNNNSSVLTYLSKHPWMPLLSTNSSGILFGGMHT